MHPLLEALRQADVDLFYRINTVWITPFLDWLMPTISDFKVFALPLALGVAALLLFGGFRGRLFLILMALALLVGDQGATQFGKTSVSPAPAP